MPDRLLELGVKIKVVSLLVVAAAASALLAAVLPDSILAGDAEPYRERMSELFSGKVPYLDFDFEHLPGAIVPMAVAWLVGGSKSLQIFALALAAVSILLISITAALLVDLDREFRTGSAIRWAVATVPLLPFLLFRNDSFVVLLAVAAFWLSARQRRSRQGTVLAWLGIASKLFPGSWAAIEWWRGKKARAAVAVALSIAALWLLRTPAVLAIQRPVGVHTETLAGSVLGFARFLSGAPLRLHRTSALYIEAEWWVHLLNTIPALVLAAASLATLRRTFRWLDAWLLFGLLTGSLMLASPLFSTQYMAWIAPFASWKRLPWLLLVTANGASLALILNWSKGLQGVGWWFALAIGRNLIFVSLLTTMGIELLRPGRQLGGSAQIATNGGRLGAT
jgi:hypothetical protein